MTRFQHVSRLALLACLAALLAACGNTRQEVNHELDLAAHEIATENLTLSAQDKAAPEAAITPDDELLVGGHPVELTAAQRTQVHAYRQQLVEMAMEGIEIGRQGAEIGLDAAAPLAIKALFGASDESIERDMQERLAPVHEAAARLCERLPALRATEQRLAAAVPAFRPYARTSEKSLRECRDEVLDATDGMQASAGTAHPPG